MYLLPQSSHYRSLYRNIPDSVALRLRTICSRDDWFHEQLQEFKQFFKRRHYSNKIINNGFDRAINTTRSYALLPKSRATDDLKNLILVMDYHPNFRDIPKLIKDHLSILYESPRMKKVFNSNKTCIRTGFRRTKNLKDLLVPSHSLMLIELMELVVILWAAFDLIDRSVMLVTIFYFQRNVLKAWLKARAIRSDSHYLAAQITSSIVPYVQYIINSVLVHQLNSGLDYPTTRVTLSRKRGRAVW